MTDLFHIVDTVRRRYPEGSDAWNDVYDDVRDCLKSPSFRKQELLHILKCYWLGEGVLADYSQEGKRNA